MPELHFNQRTPEWKAARLGKITASTAAACLGLHPHRSRQSAWREIVGCPTEAEKRNWENNQPLQWGIQFEPTARLAYEAESGNLVDETGFWVHPECPWLGASPDGLIGNDGLLEVKAPPPKKLASGELVHPYANVPIHYRIQCLIQLACTGRRFADFFAWTKDAGTRLWTIHRAGIPGLIVRLEWFYRDFVVPGICPPRKGAKA